MFFILSKTLPQALDKGQGVWSAGGVKVPVTLSKAFGPEFESLIARFSVEVGLLPEESELANRRYLSRSVAPHVSKLSSLFNRKELEDRSAALDPYWKESSNPVNLRLAYFLYFMPSNIYRMASIWAELARLGFKWSARGPLRAVEFGAGPATASCGIITGERYAPLGLPVEGNFALIEQDRAMLSLGEKWFQAYRGDSQFETRSFHRKIELKRGFLPPSAPKFNLWLGSYFLNELSETPSEIARHLLDAWEKHLDDEGIAILMEPALKLQSRKILEIRKSLLEEAGRRGIDWLKVLLPCLGHQICGAFEDPEDWCHEDVSWWRPPYFKILDDLCGLDRKSLPFSYLVIAKSKRTREELLPELAKGPADQRYRLVSPPHSEGQDLEFYVCGQDGKRRTRYRPTPAMVTITKETRELALGRGDILEGAVLRGDSNSARIERIAKIK